MPVGCLSTCSANNFLDSSQPKSLYSHIEQQEAHTNPTAIQVVRCFLFPYHYHCQLTLFMTSSPLHHRQRHSMAVSIYLIQLISMESTYPDSNKNHLYPITMTYTHVYVRILQDLLRNAISHLKAARTPKEYSSLLTFGILYPATMST